MTTILCIRKDNEVVMAGDGQATLGETVIFKSKSVKVRRIGNGKIIAGFAGAAADGITLIERLEGKLEKYANQLKRAAVELAKDWRMDKYLRQLQAFHRMNHIHLINDIFHLVALQMADHMPLDILRHLLVFIAHLLYFIFTENADAAALVDALGHHQHMVAELSAVTRRGRRGKIAHKSTFLSAGNK